MERTRDRGYALWLYDLKNFKYINDVFGCDGGNRILQYWTDLLENQGQAFID